MGGALGEVDPGGKIAEAEGLGLVAQGVENQRNPLYGLDDVFWFGAAVNDRDKPACNIVMWNAVSYYVIF
jgi:hypothetical protein